jgi:hypothetical protein
MGRNLRDQGRLDRLQRSKHKAARKQKRRDEKKAKAQAQLARSPGVMR